MLPDGWKVQTIGELCEFINGNGFKPVDWKSEGLPIIRIQNLNGSREFNYYSGEVQNTWTVMPGQLLFAWAGTKGVSFGPTVWNGPSGVLNQHIYKLDVSPDVNQDWFHESLKRITQKIEGNAHGFKATLVHVRKSDITEQLIYVPPAKEQDKISKILSIWNKAIKTTELLMINSKAKKQSLTQKLLSGKERFPEFVKSEKTRVTKFGRIPEDWKFVALKQVACEHSERHGENGNYPVLSCSKHVGFVDSLSYFNKKIYSDNTSNYKVIRRGCFGFPSNHIEEGSIGYQDVYDAGIVSPIYCVFKTDSSVHDSYLYKLLKTDQYRQIFQASTSASVDRRGSLRWKEFGNIRIPLPSYTEQAKIASILHTAGLEIHNLQQQLEKLKTEKKALMQQLLTGKRRIKV